MIPTDDPSNITLDDLAVVRMLSNTILDALISGSTALLGAAKTEQQRRSMSQNTTKNAQDDGYSLDAFVRDEHCRIEEFRKRWNQAHRINPDQFPESMPYDNQGLWTEMLNDFDRLHPFELPKPPDRKVADGAETGVLPKTTSSKVARKPRQNRRT